MPSDPHGGDLFAGERRVEPLGPGAALLGGFALDRADALIAQIHALSAASPFRHMETRSGRMSAALTNCGAMGWVSDRSGYRYTPHDPLTGAPWPALPPLFARLAAETAAVVGFADFRPTACLVNRYAPGARLGLHQDRDEGDRISPIVSVSLGLPAMFLWGGLERGAQVRRIPVRHGDVAVWGGPSRMVFHGVAPLRHGHHPATGGFRYNLTFRKLG